MYMLVTSGAEDRAMSASTGIPASNKQHSQIGLVQASLSYKLGQRLMLRATLPGPGVKHRDWATTADQSTLKLSRIVV